MNDLLKTGLFRLLSEPSQTVTNDEIENAYGCFMEQVKTTVSQSENNFSGMFRMMSITRIELVFIETQNQYGQGEKCP